MSNFFKNIMGVIYAEQAQGFISLKGVRTIELAADIQKTWGTSKIEANMFADIGRSSIKFADFFAPDVHYMLQSILSQKRQVVSPSTIRKAIAELEENTWLKNISQEITSKLDRSALSKFKLTPLPHQDEFFNIYDQRTQQYGMTGYLLSAAAGSGKTLTTLMLAEMLGCDQVVLVVPKNALHKVWARHLQEEYKVPQEFWMAETNERYNGEKFLITHYEGLEKTLEALRSKKKTNVFVALDESHHMNEMTSSRTLKFIELCKMVDSKNVIWSSGTPLKALGFEVIPLLRTIDPMFTPDVEARFKKIYGREAKRALDILRNRMGIISYKVEKSSVVDNKATTREINVKIPNGKDYELATVGKEMGEFIAARTKYYRDNFKQFEEVYDEALRIHGKLIPDKKGEKEFDTYKRYVAMIRKNYDPKTMAQESKFVNYYELKVIMADIPQSMRASFKNARTVVKYANLKVLGEALGSVLGKKRSQCHVDMLDYVDFKKIIDESEKKVVIFTSYVEVVQAAGSILKKLGYNPLLVYGETNKDLTSIIGAFDRDPKANPIVATYKSLSSAVPLISANTEIFLNQPWRDADMTQARARVDRLGQDTQVHFFNVYLDTGDAPNVSTRSKDILEWSRDQIIAIMGESYSGEINSVIASAGEYTTESYPIEVSEKDQLVLEYYQE